METTNLKSMKRKHKNDNSINIQSKRKKRKPNSNVKITKQQSDYKIKGKKDHTMSQMESSNDFRKTKSPLIENTKMSEIAISKHCDSEHKFINKKLKQSDYESTKCETSNKTHQDVDKNLKHSARHKRILSKRRKRKLAKKGETTSGSTTNVLVKPPEKPEEFSSNWKQLLTVLQKSEPKKMSKHVKKPTIRQRTSGDSSIKKTRLKKNITETQHEVEKQGPAIWFDDVDEILIEKRNVGIGSVKEDKKTDPLIKLGSYTGLTKVVSMDCEMVGIGRDGKEDMLARVSVVNQYGHCVYDQYVKPVEHVVDYRTHVSGIRKDDLDKGIEFSVVQKEVADILKNRTLVGHAIHNDMKVLYLSHPKKKIRDTSRYKPFRTLFNGRIPSLKKLTAQVLSVKVQEGEHDSVQDAQAAMRLYTMYKQQWEKDVKHLISKKCNKPKS